MGPIRAMLSDAGITEQQWRVLRVLDETGPADPTKIAFEACLLLPSLTRILQKLEDKKLIIRGIDPQDRRRQIIQIAPDGVEMIKQNLAESIALAEAMKARLGADHYEQLLDLLNQVTVTDPVQGGSS